MEYVYFLANASLILRVVEYQQRMPHLCVKFSTVIHQIDGWVVLVKMHSSLNLQQSGDVQAFLNEMGIFYQPPTHVSIALGSLEAGEFLIDVMRRYQVVVVSHGSPDSKEIEAFCHYFMQELRYCPEILT
jgi:hypothetical protein